VLFSFISDKLIADMPKVESILLVKNRALGDSVMGLSTVQYLKKIYPEKKIIYGVPAWMADLYTNPEVSSLADEILPFKLDNLKSFILLFKQISKLNITHIHEMHQSGRGSKLFPVIAFLLRVKYTAHNHHHKSESLVIDQGKTLPLIQRDLDGVFSFLGKGERPNYLDYIPKFYFKNSVTKNKTIVFGVVATRETKRWPLEDFIELAHLIERKNSDFKILIPLSKSAVDQELKVKLVSMNLPKNITFIENSLSELPILFSKALYYIGNDTGLKHIAVAAGIKTYTFFGPEPILEWHPYNLENHPVFYKENLACRTRTHHYCGLSVCDLKEENMQCLKSFRPQAVFNLMENHF
jgi:heptosyltransferase-2